ncbi:Riboflavin kinase-like protein [Glarea lozoyensis ATCC 20868]|uniref:Riboflavin kinase n=1 Tax=Glarea lozoyensis (strain ATCC 20868 / MF5171) TaxID=1116229 RepID=S3CJK6_GLAL2|nr:Riboflavin kinase-like protein [Glarea lozoyensis ATCC 20868]EPE25399.1 Riboflavin kinase-like protein [Glarea lozoyensis ATCC 20868]
MPSATESAEIRSHRPSVVGADEGPKPEYPRRMEGVVEHGFKRGSKDLGFPTANITVEGVPWLNEDGLENTNASSIETMKGTSPTKDPIDGVHFGWVSLRLHDTHPDLQTPPKIQPQHSPDRKSKDHAIFPLSDLKTPPPSSSNWRIYPMVMSIGFNPFYGNKERSAEVFIMNDFQEDFYGDYMRVSILGYIRKELNYIDVESLKNDINTDVDVALKSLARENWGVGKEESWLLGEGYSQELFEEKTREAEERARKKEAIEKAGKEKEKENEAKI